MNEQENPVVEVLSEPIRRAVPGVAAEPAALGRHLRDPRSAQQSRQQRRFQQETAGGARGRQTLRSGRIAQRPAAHSHALAQHHRPQSHRPQTLLHRSSPQNRKGPFLYYFSILSCNWCQELLLLSTKKKSKFGFFQIKIRHFEAEFSF